LIIGRKNPTLKSSREKAVNPVFFLVRRSASAPHPLISDNSAAKAKLSFDRFGVPGV
jgi:hypothetical protein